MRLNPRKILINLIKLSIAVVGLWLVVWPPWKSEPVMTWDDRITLRAGEQINGITFPDPLNVKIVEEITPRKKGNWMVRFPGWPLELQVAEVGKIRAALTDPRVGWAADQLVRELPANYFEVVDSTATEPEPKLQIGLKHLIVHSDKPLLFGAWAILVIPFFITAWRWRKLMEPQGIRMTFSKCLALTFVGQFYSTFLPGITGGDLVKIIYTSRVTGSKTKSTITILLDRVLGLLALLTVAFLAALSQAGVNVTMRNVAFLLGAILLGVACGAGAYFSRRLRRWIGMERAMAQLQTPLAQNASRLERMRRKVAVRLFEADETLHLYRGHMGVLGAAFLVSLITQVVLPLSAWMAGRAFGIHSGVMAYMAYVPLAILAASVPISPPQGFGVMEVVLLHFFGNRGTATASQTFALAQAVRFMPIAWNMVGSYWVVRGDYSRQEAPEKLEVGS